MHYGLTLTSAPVSEPIEIADVKARCRVTTSDWDGLLTSLISDERARAERVTGLRLLSQTLRLTLDEFPDASSPVSDGDTILIPGPVQSITSVVYDATDGTATTLSSTLYRLDSDGPVGRLSPAYGETWPATRDQVGAVRITYVAGYSSASAVPQEIRGKLLDAVAYRFDRGPEASEEWLDALFASLFCGVY